MWTRKELKQNAKEALRRNYWKAVLVSFILIMLGGGVSPAAASSGSTSDDSVKGEVSGYVIASNVQEMPADAAKTVTSGIKRITQTNPVVLITAAVAIVVLVLFFMAVLLVFSIFVSNPLIVGSQRFMIKSAEGEGKISEVGYAFDHAYLNCVKTMFFRELHIFLWMLLFIIPGIYKKYQYYMVEYILAENPDMPCREALNLSTAMMDGHKWNTFVLDLSFILWHMLGAVTCGLSEIFFVQPYINLTRASLYRVLMAENMKKTEELPIIDA